MTDSEIQSVNNAASVLMKQGIRLMEEGGPESAETALACFDEALEMRRGIPMEGRPTLLFGLAACWLNRADALVRLGKAAGIPEARRSYDEGIAVLRTLPFAEDPRFPRRLAIGYQNRGLALQMEGRDTLPEAVVSFNEAIAVLDEAYSQTIPDRSHLLAVVCVNLAGAHLLTGANDADSHASNAARRAVALVADLELSEAPAAEVGLKARHVLCQLLANQLSKAAQNDGMTDAVHEATDLADEGLNLVRYWEQKGFEQFRPIAFDLFRFGLRVYGIYQPQFVHDFVFDNLDPQQSSAGYVEAIRVALAPDRTSS